MTIPGPGGGMIGAFTFNGRHTSEFKLVARSVSRPLLPQAFVKRVDVQTISGVQDFDDMEYDTKEITMRIMYIGSDYHELRSRARDIAAWLTTPNWAWLILDDEPDFRHLAKITGVTELNHFFESGSIDCVFEVQPFAHSLNPVRSGTWSFLNSDVRVPHCPVGISGTRHVNNRSPQNTQLDVSLRIPTTLDNQEMTITLGNLNEASRPDRVSRSMFYRGPSGLLRIDSIKMTATINDDNAFPHFTGGDLEYFFRIPVPWTWNGPFMLVITGQSWVDNLPGSDSFVEYTPLWY